MQGEPQIYTQDRLTFIVFPSKVIVATGLQQFYLSPKAHYFNRRLNLIKAMIALQEIRDLNELATFCAPGIDWVHTSTHYDLLPHEDLNLQTEFATLGV